MSHVEENCESGIKSLLDTSAGPWQANEVDFADELYKIALQCLEVEKDKRPDMVHITTTLNNLIEKPL